MRLLRIVVVAAIVIAILTLVAYERRDAIARDVANSLLGDAGVTVVDVELETLLATRVAFGRLEVELASGTRIVFSGLDAPLSFPSLAPEHIAIRELSIVPAGQEATSRTALAPAVRTLLGLPERFPRVAVTVDRATLPDYPALDGIVWNSAQPVQRLHLGLGDLLLDAELSTVDAGAYRLVASLDVAGNAAAVRVEADVVDSAVGVEASGYGSAKLGALLPLVENSAWFPDAVDSVAGTLHGMGRVRLDADGPGSATAAVAIATDGDVDVGIDRPVAQRVAVSVSPGKPAELSLDLAQGGWSLRSPRSVWSTDLAGIDQLQVRLADLACGDGNGCVAEISAGPAPVAFDDLHVERVELDFPASLDVDDGIRIEVPRQPSLYLTGVDLAGWRIGSIASTGFTGGHARLAGDGNSLAIDALALALTNVSGSGISLDALTVRLNELAFDDGDGPRLGGGLRLPANAGSLRVGDFSMRTPGVDGTFELDDEAASGVFEIGGARDAYGFAADIRHGYAEGRGRATIVDGTVDFAARPLASLIDGVPDELDLIAGSLDVEAAVDWRPADGGLVAAGRVAFAAADLVGRYRQLAVAGLSGKVEAAVEENVFRVEPSTLAAELVDVGFPLEELAAEFRSAPGGGLAVDSATLRLLGGRLSAAPFVYDPLRTSQSVTLRLRSIQLPFMARLAGFDDIEVEGSVSGEIPVTIRKNAMGRNSIVVDAGRLDSEPPGGVLRFDAGTAAAATAGADVDFAARALQNFEFDALASEVRYGDDGDLNLNMRLSGINPDLDPTQPIILNLAIENNVPQLLRSLQAVRTIEDVLERRVAER